ncbi:MAG: glycosyltransferase family 9 protein [Gammaproteobacteria bacterium]
MSTDEIHANISKAKRILVVRAGALGDTVFCSSIIPALAHHFGDDVIIDWVAKKNIGRIFQNEPRIRHVFELKSRRAPFLVNKAKLQVVAASFREPYDYAINLELGDMFNSVMRLVRAHNKIGMPYTHFSAPAETHAVENLHIIYRSFLDEADIRYAANSHHDKTSSINHRAWPVSHWQSLMKLLNDNGVPNIIIGGKGEDEYFSGFGKLPQHTISLAGRTGFGELISVIQGAKCVVSTDTGPSHIAAAVNTPVITLIGPTNPSRTGPYRTKSNKVLMLNAHLPCSPCYHTERLKNCQHNLCMEKIVPEQVLQAVLNELGTHKSSRLESAFTDQ